MITTEAEGDGDGDGNAKGQNGWDDQFLHIWVFRNLFTKL